MGLITGKSNKAKQEELDVITRKKNVTRLTISDLIIPIASGIVFTILLLLSLFLWLNLQ